MLLSSYPSQVVTLAQVAQVLRDALEPTYLSHLYLH